MISSLVCSVAYVVQTVPLCPTSCCTADTGPTLQMAIHQHPDFTGKLSEDDISRLSLFMFTVTPNIPGAPGGGSGGPMNIIGKFSNLLLAKTGWALGFGMTEVETEYLTFKQVSPFYLNASRLPLTSLPAFQDTPTYFLHPIAFILPFHRFPCLLRSSTARSLGLAISSRQCAVRRSSSPSKETMAKFAETVKFVKLRHAR